MERVNGKIGTLSDWRQVTSGWNASSWHRHYLYSAALLYFYAPHHHFSFLISHSIEAFNRNQGAVRPMDLPPSPSKGDVK